MLSTAAALRRILHSDPTASSINAVARGQPFSLTGTRFPQWQNGVVCVAWVGRGEAQGVSGDRLCPVTLTACRRRHPASGSSLSPFPSRLDIPPRVTRWPVAVKESATMERCPLGTGMGPFQTTASSAGGFLFSLYK